MNQVKQLSSRSNRWTAQPKRAGTQSQHGSAPAGPANVRQPLAMNQPSRAPTAPPAFRTQAQPNVLQTKVPGPSLGRASRMMAGPASGVVQANVIGGNRALQARLNVWNTGPKRATNTPSQDKGGSSAQVARASNGAQAIQRKSGPGVEAFRVPLREKSGGLPLPDAVRTKMETAFSTDFSDVRVHIGREASSLGAIAYTWGTNIHFAPGQYNPHTLQGQKLLGHELWHVVQQKNGRVRNPFGGGVAVVQDHALEAEADRMGIKAALTPTTRNTDR